jgi:DNA-binding MarR family transcriptional regulator
MSTVSKVNFRAAPANRISITQAPFHEVPFSTTLLVRDTCLCLHVQKAARLLARRFDVALRPVGLTNGQFSLMMSLNRPDLPGVPRATMGSVAELLGMDRTTLTAAVKTLQRRGLVSVLADAKDKRERRMVLTEDGQRMLAAATPIWTKTHAEVESGLAEGDAERLRRNLLTLGTSNEAKLAPAS